MDPADLSQVMELAEYQRNQEIAILPKPVRESAKWCEGAGCGQRIPEERRKQVPGVRFCVECQQWHEFMEGRYADSN